MKKALIVWGGWDGHEPKQVADVFAAQLRKNDFEVEVSETLDSFLDADKLKGLNLIVPEWTMGTISDEQLKGILSAVEGGVGIAGVHGGMADSFRQNTNYQFLVGGQWVAHPDGVIRYEVHIVDHADCVGVGVLVHDLFLHSVTHCRIDPAVDLEKLVERAGRNPGIQSDGRPVLALEAADLPSGVAPHVPSAHGRRHQEPSAGTALRVLRTRDSRCPFPRSWPAPLIVVHSLNHPAGRCQWGRAGPRWLRAGVACEQGLRRGPKLL